MCASAYRPSPGFDPVAPRPTGSRRRYALVGCGARSQMYQDAIQGRFASFAELVAVCDSNPGRVELTRERSARNSAPIPAGYVASDFERMVSETRPDVVIVLTVDAAHHLYIVRAMRSGCDVITEKPMTTTAAACCEILEARRETGRQCRVTFNYRYSPPRTQVKDLLMSGAIGEVLSVDFHWLLDTVHGADYFRRWHAEKRNSGGLLVHKATHHFDLVNWWLSAVPVSVFASGSREFYTPQTARRLGLSGPQERCRTCPEKRKCGFYLDLGSSDSLRRLYLDQEHFDGYFRDRCVWRPEIDIEDTMSVQVHYDTGARLTYSLSAYNAWEGYTVTFNGTQGRLEHSMAEQVYVSGRDAVQGGAKRGGILTRVIPLRGAPQEIPIWKAEGSHGGGDDVLLDDLFGLGETADRFLRAADDRAGAQSIAVGLAANRCFETGLPVRIADFLPGLERPDFPPMPGRDAPLVMPPRM
jgi:predicted dehydrogenase